ncbi:hypothetical protein OJF2_44900 [Aquisphaera giovannonii]|uniref:Uncharacterized protein n=1 Tax=Aquisphaera giovannonii TaxID=406548 RepID=A0A5B9W5Q3_9BACT|nr:hypothetical protein [Aquisphaera giovannonii]QEH35933.1 hypothetical protein OJF2_44900 [Aquisphaera giovannonii]
MGLTSWVIASVSTWMVPAYVTAMVLIFATPRAPRRDGEKGEASEAQRDGAGSPADPGRPADAADRPRKGRKAPMRPRTPATAEGLVAGEGPEGGAADLRVDGPEANLDPATDPAEPPAAKPRRTRGRAKRTARPGAEPALAPAPATWIQVAPGKFVRADLHEPRPEAVVPDAPAGAPDVTPEPEPASQAPAEVHEAFAEAPEPGPQSEHGPQPLPFPPPDPTEVPDPIAGPPEAEAPVEDARIEAMPEPPFEPPAPTDAPEDVADPHEDLDAPEGPEPDAEPAAEEYGIAPSALGEDPPSAASPEADDETTPQAASPEPEDDPASRPDEPECGLEPEAATPIEPAHPASFDLVLDPDEGIPGPPPGAADEGLDAGEMDAGGWDRDEEAVEDAAVPAALALDAIAGQGRGDDGRDRASTAGDADLPDMTVPDRGGSRPTPAPRAGSRLSSRASFAAALRVTNIRTGPPARPRVLKASPPPRGTRTPSRRNAGRRPGVPRQSRPRSPPLRV